MNCDVISLSNSTIFIIEYGSPKAPPRTHNPQED